jgi:tRNA (cytidine/uridine-2'-O-)-methyltransferase
MSSITVTPPRFDPPELGGAERHVVLVTPEIPQNTGNVARLCAGSDTWLHLVEPLGFELSDRYLRRAGLDYWPGVRLSVHRSLDALEAALPHGRTWWFTKHAGRLHSDVTYAPGSVLVFGRETAGLDDDVLARHADYTVRIPTTSRVRSLNLANSVAIGIYELIRQSEWRGEIPMGARDQTT